MSEHSLPADSVSDDAAPTDAAVAESAVTEENQSPLDAAAAKGPLSWPSAPDTDPEGAPDPQGLADATEPQDLIAFNLRR